MFQLDLSDHTIIVTGALGGLGLAIVNGILEAGGDVVCSDMAETPARENVDLVFSNPGVSYIRCDVTNENEVERSVEFACDKAKMRGKPVQGLVCCAGIQEVHEATEFPADVFRGIMDVNVVGSFLAAKHTARAMKKNKASGSIVMIASVAGYVTNRGIQGSAYCASKDAVHGLRMALAPEFGRLGIRINTVSPGPIKTDMIDSLLKVDTKINDSFMAATQLGHLGVPDDIKGIVLYLLSARSRYVTGADLLIDGGMRTSV